MTITPFEVHTGPFAENPYPILARLREDCPVYRQEAMQAWWVTRYDDVRFVVQDEEHFLPATGIAGPGIITMMHGEEHRRYRALVTPAFAVGALRKALAPLLPPLVHSLVDAFPHGEVDLVSAFANPIPAAVMTHILQVEGFDADTFMRDAEVMLESVAQPHNAEIAALAPEASRRVARYIRAAVAAERAAPRGGFLTELSALTELEVAGFCSVLLIAGVETTQRLISNLVYALCTHGDMERVASDRELLVPAIEETLRYYPPNHFRMRTVIKDFELHGVTVRRGERVYALTGGANRDPRAFDDPERFDVERFRDLRKTQPHLSFGWGPHYCLGAYLSKLETEYAAIGLLDRLAGITLDGPVRFAGFRNRSPEKLPLRFREARSAGWA